MLTLITIIKELCLILLFFNKSEWNKLANQNLEESRKENNTDGRCLFLKTIFVRKVFEGREVKIYKPKNYGIKKIMEFK